MEKLFDRMTEQEKNSIESMADAIGIMMSIMSVIGIITVIIIMITNMVGGA